MAKKLGNLAFRKSSEIGFSSIFNWFALCLAATALTLFSSSRAVGQGSPDSSQQQTQTNTQQEPAQPQSDQRRVISKDTTGR